MLRAACVVFALSVVAFADEDADAMQREIELLTDPSPFVRDEAQRRLTARGRSVVEHLRGVDAVHPERALRIRAILRHFERFELTARLETNADAQVEIVAQLSNHTRRTHVVPLFGDAGTPLAVVIDKRVRRLAPGDIRFRRALRTGEFVSMAPGDSIELRVAIRPDDFPAGASRHRIAIIYRSRSVLLVDRNQTTAARVQGDAVRLSLSSQPIEIDLATRTPDELDRALDHADTRRRALIEIRFRSDDAIVPLLRKRAADPDLRLHVIKALGARAKEEDLALIYRGTKDPEAAVRRAATSALANFPQRKARVRLCVLAKDAELQTLAVKALASHKHARTIDTFIDVLQARFREGPWVPPILDLLKEWTGQPVRNTPQSVAAFKRWWKVNRASWIEAN